MIPMDHLQQWALIAPWPDAAQIEQDLIILSRFVRFV